MHDLIRRQDAIDAISRYIAGVPYEKAKRILNAVPSAQKKGKWINVPHKKARICSICEHDEPYKFADDDVNVFAYCPNCGADMRGEHDG